LEIVAQTHMPLVKNHLNSLFNSKRGPKHHLNFLAGGVARS